MAVGSGSVLELSMPQLSVLFTPFPPAALPCLASGAGGNARWRLSEILALRVPWHHSAAPPMSLGCPVWSSHCGSPVNGNKKLIHMKKCGCRG